MRFERFIHQFSKLIARLGGLIILLSAILVSMEVISRNLGLGIRFHAFDLTNYGFAAAIAFGFAFALTQKANIRIDFVYQILPIKVKAMLDIASIFLVSALAFGMAYFAWKVVTQSLQLGARPNSTLEMPLALPQTIWALGLSWFSFISLCVLISAIRTVMKKNGWALAHSHFGIQLEEKSESIK